jgi:hypothetical protein
MFEHHESSLCKYVVSITVLAIGCGDEPRKPDMPLDAPPFMADAPFPMPDAPPDAPAPIEVRGTGSFRSITDSGIVERPRNFATATLTSFTPIGPSGTEFEQLTGTGSSGSFVVPVRPGASQWQLAVGFGGAPFVFVGDDRRVDLSLVVLGRLDAEFATRPTPVTINATGLAAWQFGDVLQVVSSNAGAFLVNVAVEDPPAPGDTALTGKLVDWQREGEALIAAAKGDVTLVHQLTARAPSPSRYHAIARMGTSTPFTITDGEPATLAAALDEVPQSRSVAVQVRRTQFDAFRDQIGPRDAATESGFQTFFIEALPHAAEFGRIAQGAHLVEFFAPAGDLDYAQAFTYGNPFKTGSTAWDEVASVLHRFDVPVLAAGATTPARVPAGFTSNIPISALEANGTIAPIVSPVRNVTIASKDAAVPQTGVGLAPLIKWDAPSAGTPTVYELRLQRVTANQAQTQLTTVATFRTTATSLQVPGTFLHAGASFIMQLTAFADPGYDTAAPFLDDGGAWHSVTSVTAQFTP